MPKQKTTKGPPLSDYEKARLARIAENKLILDRLKLERLSKNQPKKEPRKRRTPSTSFKKAAAPKKGMCFSSPMEWMEWKTANEPRRSTRRRGFRPTHDALTDSQVRDFGRKKDKNKSVRKAMMKRDLTQEQLDTLASHEDWLDDLEEFLVTIPHGNGNKVISPDNCRTVMRQMRILASGAGVEYRHWKEGVIFRKGQPVTLRTDAVKVWYEAWAFQNEHGRDKGNGWLLLHPLTKLACYQSYKLGGQDEDENDEEDDDEKEDEEMSSSSLSSSSSSSTSSFSSGASSSSRSSSSPQARKKTKRPVSVSKQKAAIITTKKKEKNKKRKSPPSTTSSSSSSSPSSMLKRAKRVLGDDIGSTAAVLPIGTKVKALWGGQMYNGKIENIFAAHYDIAFDVDFSIAKVKKCQVFVK
jgi:hypothetical protein